MQYIYPYIFIYTGSSYNRSQTVHVFLTEDNRDMFVQQSLHAYILIIIYFPKHVLPLQAVLMRGNVKHAICTILFCPSPKGMG